MLINNPKYLYQRCQLLQPPQCLHHVLFINLTDFENRFHFLLFSKRLCLFKQPYYSFCYAVSAIFNHHPSAKFKNFLHPDPTQRVDATYNQHQSYCLLSTYHFWNNVCLFPTCSWLFSWGYLISDYVFVHHLAWNSVWNYNQQYLQFFKSLHPTHTTSYYEAPKGSFPLISLAVKFTFPWFRWMTVTFKTSH